MIEASTHNPVEDAQRLWTPSRELPTLPLDQVVMYRREPVVLQGDPNRTALTDTHVLAAEALHFYGVEDTERASAAAETVGVSSRVMDQTQEIVYRAAGEMVRSTVRAVDKHIADTDISDPDGDKRIILAADLLNRAAHTGEVRDNELDYDTHPLAVSGIIQEAATRNKLFEDDPIDLVVLRALGLVHDALEHAQHKDGSVSPLSTKRLHVSPLFLTELLKRLDVPKEQAETAGNGLATVTYVKGVDGKEAGYSAYVLPALHGPVTGALKRADFLHNDVLDPKEEPIDSHKKKAYTRWLLKRDLYSLGTEIVTRNAEDWVGTYPDHSVLIRRGIPDVVATPHELTDIYGQPIPRPSVPPGFGKSD